MQKKDKYELYPTKKVAPAILGYLAALLYVAVAVCAILGFINIKDTFGIIMLCSAGGIVLLLVIMAKAFAWERKAELYKKGNRVIYETYDVVGGITNGKTTVEIIDITDVKYSSKTDVCKLKCKYYPKGKDKKAKENLQINYCTQEAYNFLKNQIEKK